MDDKDNKNNEDVSINMSPEGNENDINNEQIKNKNITENEVKNDTKEAKEELNKQNEKCIKIVPSTNALHRYQSRKIFRGNEEKLHCIKPSLNSGRNKLAPIQYKFHSHKPNDLLEESKKGIMRRTQQAFSSNRGIMRNESERLVCTANNPS